VIILIEAKGAIYSEKINMLFPERGQLAPKSDRFLKLKGSISAGMSAFLTENNWEKTSFWDFQRGGQLNPEYPAENLGYKDAKELKKNLNINP